jgi:hypothetical protein
MPIISEHAQYQLQTCARSGNRPDAGAPVADPWLNQQRGNI